jgi:UDP-N-acetylglucosamine--N-acetylmuramyl-(pentapeptide) pyrophosphoryl-undecaprenol N-acetylglucosamine transferase
MLAALLRGERTLLHDQNAYLGRTNRLLARFVRRIALSYEQTHAIPASATHKTTCVGSPVRAAVAVVGEAPYPQRRAGQPFYLLVIGGSQGAKIFSTLVPKAIALLPQEVRAQLRLVQQCRSEDNAYVRTTYREMGMEVELAPFFPDIAARMVSAHLVITRAGASSVAEMCVAGRPAIYVPLPSAMDNHQWFNAKLAGDAGAAWLFEESTLTPDILAETLNRAIAEPETLQHMAGLAKTLARPHAAEALCDLVIKEMTA